MRFVIRGLKFLVPRCFEWNKKKFDRGFDLTPALSSRRGRNICRLLKSRATELAGTSLEKPKRCEAIPSPIGWERVRVRESFFALAFQLKVSRSKFLVDCA